MSCERALGDAQGKAAGLFPADVARALLGVSKADWDLVRWSDPPPVSEFLGDLQHLGERLLLVR
jgi:hypothetical protein